MGTFELGRDIGRRTNDLGEAGITAANRVNLDPRRLRQECLISLKVYDACRLQDCLTEKEIGPARAAENKNCGETEFREDEIISAPPSAASVTIDRLFVKRVIIVNKEPCTFKAGFWDVDLKYVFEYHLVFRTADGTPFCDVKANSIFNKRVTLFGSIGSDIVITTDLFGHAPGESAMLNADPFIMVESKGVALNAELKYPRSPRGHMDCPCQEPIRVIVTIGLFTIVKLFRIVQLLVESRGFCVPPECQEIAPLNPCDFFDKLDFPMDIFAPPQRPEFVAGISSNVPSGNKGGPCLCGS